MTARRIRRLVVAAALVTVGVLAAAGPAAAQTAPAPTVPPGCLGGPAGPPTPGTVCPPTSSPPVPAPGASPGAQPTGDSMIPDPQLSGKFPTRHYDIGFDSGAWNSFPARRSAFSPKWRGPATG